jgi:hypothetical protein
VCLSFFIVSRILYYRTSRQSIIAQSPFELNSRERRRRCDIVFVDFSSLLFFIYLDNSQVAGPATAPAEIKEETNRDLFFYMRVVFFVFVFHGRPLKIKRKKKRRRNKQLFDITHVIRLKQ